MPTAVLAHALCNFNNHGQLLPLSLALGCACYPVGRQQPPVACRSSRRGGSSAWWCSCAMRDALCRFARIGSANPRDTQMESPGCGHRLGQPGTTRAAPCEAPRPKSSRTCGELSSSRLKLRAVEMRRFGRFRAPGVQVALHAKARGAQAHMAVGRRHGADGGCTIRAPPIALPAACTSNSSAQRPQLSTRKGRNARRKG